MRKNMLIHTCEVWRKEKITGKGLSSAFVKKYENVPCLILPQTEQSNIQGTVNIGKDYVAYFDQNADVIEGDKIKFSGTELLVNGEANYKNIPRISHKEMTCQTVGD